MLRVVGGSGGVIQTRAEFAHLATLDKELNPASPTGLRITQTKALKEASLTHEISGKLRHG